MNPIEWLKKEFEGAEHPAIKTTPIEVPVAEEHPLPAGLVLPAPVIHVPVQINPPPVVFAPMQINPEPKTAEELLAHDVAAVPEPTPDASPAPAAVVSEAKPSPPKVATPMTSIVTKIATGAVTLWDDIEKDVDADYAAVKAALPASAQVDLAASVSDVKQGASDVLSMADSAASAILPDLTSGLEKVLDTAMTTYTNGAALPLVPLVNAGLDSIGNAAIATINAAILKAKASLAPAAPAAA